MGQVDGKVALVTGGASGIGAACSMTLAREGAKVVVTGRKEDAVAEAVRQNGARVVHAHNLLPAFGWRALQAARAAGARTVLHLHNYRLVCAVGTCFTRGSDCTRCHGRNTVPGVRLNCRALACTSPTTERTSASPARSSGSP